MSNERMVCAAFEPRTLYQLAAIFNNGRASLVCENRQIMSRGQIRLGCENLHGDN